ncbi:MAG: tRNA (adenosine(37)-N6)-threonylcarbamoyltransferase complex dimerization subunit type 1 TsaB [Rhodobacter sp.]|nr:tRNA (adenosine(37)-N6)-threonylcarbamoyltransferase complex dimerization subunit type 1 TsaB [Rhodobacter sp.]
MPDPLVLGFDTSAAHCAAALLSGDTVLDVRAEEMGRGQAERLMPMLEEMLGAQRAVWADLAALGVGTGPGNFTGTRIAVSAARGLALGLGVRAIGVTAFEATALGQARPITVTVPAPRGQVYVQRFVAEGADTPRLCPEGEVGGPVVPCLPPDKLAVAIARVAADRRDTAQARPAPLYIRPADAAPPREAPPVILP